MPLDLPDFFWAFPILRHPGKARLDARNRDHFFVARPAPTYRNGRWEDTPFAACSMDIHPRLHGQERRVRKTPSPKACQKCIRAWRAGWGAP